MNFTNSRKVIVLWFYVEVKVSVEFDTVRNVRQIIATAVYYCHLAALSLINTEACSKRRLIKKIAFVLVTGSVTIYL
jgi:hypothetical protein